MPKPARGCDHPTDRFMYYMHDEFAAFRLLLIGDLSQGSTTELDEARQTASSIFNGRPLIVDLTGIDTVDKAGRELIAKWHGLGTQLVVTTPEAQVRIQSMTNMPIVLLAKKRPSKWLRLPALFAPTATFLMLLMLMLMGGCDESIRTDQTRRGGSSLVGNPPHWVSRNRNATETGYEKRPCSNEVPHSLNSPSTKGLAKL